MSTNKFRTIALAGLLPHPHNPRTDLGDPQKLSELANDLAANGNKTALRVFPIAEGEDQGKFLIIEGHRRRAAAELGNVAELFCEIDPTLDTLPKQLESMLRENTHREPISAINEAAAIQTMMEFDGYGSVAKVAKAINRSQSTVRKRLLLNTLNDEAKTRIEDNTLNIDQALVLADFTEDEAATQRLLRVADKPNDWAFQLTKETKTKAWLENLPRLTAELQGAGVDIVARPEGQTWQWTEWRVAYQEMTVAEAVAGGWSAICDESQPEITWVKKRPAGSTSTVQQRTPEQLADEIRRQELTRGLTTAAEVRTAFIKDAIQKPAADKTHEMLVDYVLARHHLVDIAPWLDIDDEDIDQQEVIDAVSKLNIPQLVALMHVDQFEREMHMTDVDGWRAGPGWQSTESWRGKLESVHGYQWTEAEQAALDYHEEKSGDDE